MKNSTRKASRRRVLIRRSVIAALALMTGVAIRRVRAEVSCAPVHGTITSVITNQNCTSPIGICTVGVLRGSGLLDGTTNFIALDAAPAAGMPNTEPARNLSYSGQLTIVTANGTLVTRDLGVLDAVHTAFTEVERPQSGTGVFSNPVSNDFFISGSIVNNGQGFQGNLSGLVCATDN